MSRIPTRLTPEAFRAYVQPYLRTAKRGYVCKIQLYRAFNYILYRLYTGCQWDALPIAADPQQPNQKEGSPGAVAYHFRKWCRDGSLKQVWQNRVQGALGAVRAQGRLFLGLHCLAFALINLRDLVSQKVSVCSYKNSEPTLHGGHPQAICQESSGNRTTFYPY